MAKPPQRRAGDQGSAGGLGNPLTLALFLLLAGFFAFLVGISSFDGGKQQSVLRSVAERFDVQLERIAQGPVTGDTGAGQGSAQAQESIARLFERELAVASVDVLREGDRLEIVTPASALFEADSSALKPAREPLVARVAEMLAGGRRTGNDQDAFDVELVMADPGFEPDAAGPEDSRGAHALSVARLGRVAQRLGAAGAPQAALGIGLTATDGGEAALHWRFQAAPADGRDPLFGGRPGSGQNAGSRP